MQPKAADPQRRRRRPDVAVGITVTVEVFADAVATCGVPGHLATDLLLMGPPVEGARHLDGASLCTADLHLALTLGEGNQRDVIGYPVLVCQRTFDINACEKKGATSSTSSETLLLRTSLGVLGCDISNHRQ